MESILSFYIENFIQRSLLDHEENGIKSINDNNGLMELSNNFKYIQNLNDLVLQGSNMNYDGISLISENLKFISNLGRLSIGGILFI